MAKFSWLQNHPILCSAPIYNITDSPQRQIYKKLGANVVFSEMVSSIGLYHQNPKSIKLSEFSSKEKPVIIQLFGHNADILVKAAQIIEKKGASGIDFNCGCPSKKIISAQDGSQLLNTPDILIDLLQQIKKNIRIPLSLKTRIGYHKLLPISFYKNIIDKSNIDCLILHGRTVKQKFSGQADWNRIKQIAKSVNIPVIGNGDIVSVENAINRIKKFTPSGIMIGRGSFGNPWIFSQIKSTLKHHTCQKPSPDNILKIINIHTYLISKHYSDSKKALFEIKKHCQFYFKYFPDSKALRQKIISCQKLSEIKNIIKQNTLQ